MYAKTLREQLPRLADQMTQIVAKAKTDNRGLTSDERTAFHSLETDYSNLEDSIKIAEKSQSIIDDLATAAPGTVISAIQTEQLQDEFRIKGKKDKTPYGLAFDKYLRNGLSGLDRDETKLLNQFRNAQSTTTTTAGGFTVATDMAQSILQAMKWFGGVDGVTGKLVTEQGNPIQMPTNNDTTNHGRMLSQNTQVTETDLVFGQITLNAYIGSSDVILASLALMADSHFDLGDYIGKQIGTRLGRLYNFQCTQGSGTNAPLGIVPATLAQGNEVVFPVGETATITYSNLVDIQHSVDNAYRQNATWMFSDSTLKLFKKLVDGQGRPLWLPALSSSFQIGAQVDPGAFKPQILDSPYIVNNDMGAPAASVESVIYGDLSKYVVREADNGNTTLVVLRERYADFGQIAYLGWRRFDGQLLDAGTHPLACGVQSAT